VSALVLSEVLAAKWETTDCRICGAGSLDESARDALRWSHPQDAQDASDVIAKLAIPLLAGADALRSTRSWGNAGRDALVVAEAFALTGLTTAVAKGGFARLRPGLPDEPGQASGAYHSLWSSHSSLAFSVAVAQAMQDSLRGDRAAPWVWAIGLTLASSVAYLRVAGDAHWLTDVLAGAAVGSAFGVGVPLLERRLVKGVTLSPAPGGIALRF
jgi:membrane-associated phospholipid phosphatase